LKVVQERLGHTSIATTGDIYAHVSRDVDKHAAKEVAAAIWGVS
jgi:integrase